MAHQNSPGLDFASECAAAEATASRHEFVEPAHLFIGVCSLEKADEDELTADAAAAIRAEEAAMAALLGRFGWRPDRLRRAMRERIEDGTFLDSARRRGGPGGLWAPGSCSGEPRRR